MFTREKGLAIHEKDISRALNRAVKEKKWGDAAHIVAAQVAQKPSDPQLRLLAGEMSTRAGRREEAAKHYLAGAQIYSEQDNPAKAAAVCKKVVALDPSLQAECDSILSPVPTPLSAKPTPPADDSPSDGDGSLWRPSKEVSPETRERFGEWVKDLPEFPTITNRLCMKLQDTACTPSEVANIAKADPVLVREVLRVVNSAYFGLQTEVSDMFRAILLLGYNYVYHMALRHTMKRCMPLALPEETVGRLWLHSLLVSSCAAHLAKTMKSIPEGLATTVGLLQDLGKIVCYLVEPVQMALLESEAHGSVERELLQEEEVFGANHALLGALLAEHWNLPVTIQKATAYHHNPLTSPPEDLPEDVLEVVALSCACDLTARMFESPSDTEPAEDLLAEYYPILRRTPPVAGFLTPALAKELAKTRSFFEGLQQMGTKQDEGAAAAVGVNTGRPRRR